MVCSFAGVLLVFELRHGVSPLWKTCCFRVIWWLPFQVRMTPESVAANLLGR